MQKSPFNIMTKPIGPRCNIKCDYCYYLEKKDYFPDEKKFVMPDPVLERYIQAHIAESLASGMREVTFAWQGGEPTMLGLDYFKTILMLQKTHAPKGVKISNLLQTNGMLLDEEWGAFLKENGFLVGLSIDGPKEIHNRYRRDAAGRPSFDAVMKGLEILQRHGVDYNVLTVIHRQNASKGRQIYKFLKGLGVDYMQFIPIVERSGKGQSLAGAPQIDEDPALQVTEWSVGSRAYGKFLSDVFDVWVKKDVGKIFVQHFDAMLGQWLGEGSSICVFAKQCGNGLAMEHNGNLYSCDHYVYPEYLLGNIMTHSLEEMIWSPKQRAFGRSKESALTRQCQDCSFRFACNGGCPKHRFVRSKDGEEGHNYFCEGYRFFFNHAKAQLSEMAWLLKMGRPASDIGQ